MALAVVGGVVDHRHGLEAKPGDQFRVGIVLVDHRAVDAMNFRILVAIGDVGQHGAPHDHRKTELVVDVDGCDRRRRAIMRGAGDDVFVGCHLGGDLHRDVRFALIVEHDQLIFVFRLGVGIAQLHGQIRRIAAAEAVDRDAARERPDEADFHLVLGVGCTHRERKIAVASPMAAILPILIISPSLNFLILALVASSRSRL